MQRHRVVVVGSTTIDKVIQHATSVWKLGGVTTYAGLSFQRQHVETTILSNVATRHKGILETLRRRGLRVSCDSSKATTCFIHDIKGDHRRQQLLCTADPIQIARIIPLLHAADLLSLGPLFPADLESEQLELLRHRVPCISLDLQGYVREQRRGLVHPAVSDLLPHALRVADIIKADYTELSYILERYEISLPRLMRRFSIQEIVVTQGSQGGIVKDIDGNELRYKACPVSVDGDSTGAGDVFFATYLTQRLFHGQPAEDAANTAARQAARQVEGTYITADELRLPAQILATEQRHGMYARSRKASRTAKRH
ncbi:hypothetical protein CSB45_11985 [candidate division KSB3 bacterium]|uniref:Carbohydrate kinase PfkB domain-containing protein n=1 Tax=candidate division KSB3 bacterium TaxID=2044937 RepID=A0A2G6E2C8_9BACT|nr:MAG: hypothetical protein CSB45_11985 [candidate division KSB3 bacterium]PIE28817.1 MAG: hypothetical protein CSA57_11660 [candidate division KSB3 bacterium]